jgi:ribose transport system ATP-binding protein
MIEAAQRVLDTLGIDVDPRQTLGSYDFSSRQLIEIAKAFSVSIQYPVYPIILLDECTEVLSSKEMDLLFSNIRKWKTQGCFVFVSHRLSEALEICDRVCILKDGSVVDIMSNAGLQEEHLHELMVGRKKELEYYHESEQIRPSEKVLLSVEELTAPGHFDSVSLELHGGEILGIAGVRGSGKSALGRAIAGALPSCHGTLSVRGQRFVLGSVEKAIRGGIGYVPAERKTDGLISYLSVTWNISLPSVLFMNWHGLPLLDRTFEQDLAEKYVRRLRIKTPSLNTLAANLSGGNQQKVVLSKWLATRMQILVLDDPTRGIDVGAKEEIYQLLRELTGNGIGILLISDNLVELIGLSNRILVMKGGRIVSEILSDVGHKPQEVEVVRHMV